MDDLETRESFLRAIFDRPTDTSPRLVFADWLEEQGENAWAELIRNDCNLQTSDKRSQLIQEICQGDRELMSRERELGFVKTDTIEVGVSDLENEERFRYLSIKVHPEWFGANTVVIKNGIIMSAKPFDTLLRSNATKNVSKLIVAGIEEKIGSDGVFAEYNTSPVLTMTGLEALAKHRFASRLNWIDVTNNDLGNDAVRILARSPMLDQLKNLSLIFGNRFKGRVFQELYSRFGENVVS